MYAFSVGAIAAIIFLFFSAAATAIQPNLRVLLGQSFGFYRIGEEIIAWGIFVFVGLVGSLFEWNIRSSAIERVLRALYWTGIAVFLALPCFFIFKLLYF